jgi:hypothetical protein
MANIDRLFVVKNDRLMMFNVADGVSIASYPIDSYAAPYKQVIIDVTGHFLCLGASALWIYSPEMKVIKTMSVTDAVGMKINDDGSIALIHRVEEADGYRFGVTNTTLVNK